MSLWKLRFDPKSIDFWAGRYSDPGEDELLETVVLRARLAGCLSKEDLVALGNWKSQRAVPLLKRNEEEEIVEITRVALTTPSERLRIGSLLQLVGVGWPMASVVLHLCHHDPYPILDFRALWSVGRTVPAQYNFAFWWAYTNYCRELAERTHVTMRTLDRALWQYSKENQTRETASIT